MIDRDLHVQRIAGLLKRFPVVALLGARQVGKTTLAGLIAPSLSDHNIRFDLENPADLARLADPMLALQGLTGLVVLDEVQRVLNGCRLIVNLTGVVVPELPIKLEGLTLAMPSSLTI